MILKELFLILAVHLTISLCEPQTQQLDNLKINENDNTKEDLKTAASEGLYQYAGYGAGKYPYTNGLYGGGSYGGVLGHNNYGYSSPSYDYSGHGGYGSYGKGYGSSNTYFYPNVGTGYSNYPLNGYGGYGGYGGNGGLLSYSGYQHQGYYNNGLRGYDSTLSGNLGYGYYSQNYPNHDYNGYSKYPSYSYRGGYSLPGYVSGYRGYTR